MEFEIIEIYPTEGGYSALLTDTNEGSGFQIRVSLHTHSTNQAAGHITAGPKSWSGKLMVLENNDNLPVTKWETGHILRWVL